MLQRSGEALLRLFRTVKPVIALDNADAALEIVRTIDDQADKPQVNHTH